MINICKNCSHFREDSYEKKRLEDLIACDIAEPEKVILGTWPFRWTTTIQPLGTISPVMHDVSVRTLVNLRGKCTKNPEHITVSTFHYCGQFEKREKT